MNRLFQSVGILATIAALVYGAIYLYENFTKIAATLLQVFGLIALVGLLGFLLLKLAYGKQWLIKGGSQFYFGGGLISSSKKVIQDVKERDLKEDTLAEFVAHLIWRITRIGIFAFLLGLIPFILLYQQNQLISKQNGLFEYQNVRVEKQTALIEQQTELLGSQDEKFGRQNDSITDQNTFIDKQTGLLERQDIKFGLQNELLRYQNIQFDSQISLTSFQNTLLDTQNYRINLQNNLIEAGRRGSLIILMSNIMDQVNEEIQMQNQDSTFNDSLGYALSDPLIGRIAALSQGFLPYRFLQGDTLTKKETSPERGQLLLALVKSNLDSVSYFKICSAADFHYAYLNGADLGGVDLGGVGLGRVDLSWADLREADLGWADLREAMLFGAKLFGANLGEAILSGANLGGADLSGVDLGGADLSGVDLGGADLAYADLKEVRNLTKDQLIKVRRLIGIRNLNPVLESELKAEKPCLFTWRGCN